MKKIFIVEIARIVSYNLLRLLKLLGDLLMSGLKEKYEQLVLDNGGAYFPGIINDEKKSDNFQTPLFENMTNALEAIKLKYDDRNYCSTDAVVLKLVYEEADDKQVFSHIELSDTGIGFNYEQFKSFCTYKFNKKGFNNKGCGRFQSLLHFDKCTFDSIFIEDGKKYNIVFDFSEKHVATKGIQIIEFKEVTIDMPTGTILKMVPPINDVKFSTLTSEMLKKDIIKKYALEFVLHDQTPEIKIINSSTNTILNIVKGQDIPSTHKQKSFELNFKTLDNNSDLINVIGKVATFSATFIPFPEEVLDTNEVFICCKNEAVKEVEFNAFASKDTLNKQRFLCFISSPAFENSNNIDNCRQDVKNIVKTEDQAASGSGKRGATLSLWDEFILQEDIENKTASSLYILFPDAKIKETQKRERINDLQNIFGFEDNDRLSIKTSDGNKQILEKVYRSEAIKQANLDAQFADTFINLKKLDPNSKDYDEKFEELNGQLNDKIPLRNKNNLSKYMIGRKAVLELFKLILGQRLEVQTTNLEKRKQEEKRLHNLIFRQHTTDVCSSNLWLLNEEFIYFDGYSEFQLNTLKDKDGNQLFDFSGLSEEDKKLIESRDEDRPDIILFPEEGKCIIIELKAPGVRLNHYIGQTEDYARIISSCVSENNKIDMFYSYLIVDEDNLFDVPSEYEEIYHMKNTYFCPSKKVKAVVNGERVDVAYIYGEILRYKDIYERASLRNKIFTHLLQGKNDKTVATKSSTTNQKK